MCERVARFFLASLKRGEVGEKEGLGGNGPAAFNFARAETRSSFGASGAASEREEFKRFSDEIFISNRL